MAHIMISCGEASGDLYAGALVEALRRAEPDVRVFGFGGDRLAAAGAELVGDYRGHTVTGLVEVIKHLPGTYRLYRQLVAVARERRPDVFVAIDFPDFNFKLGQAIHALGIPVVYYISPQLWAWRPGRLRTMKAFVDRVLPIFPFEEKVYRDAGIPVEFVGHPLIDLATATEDRATFLRGLGLRADAPTVALLPGSRPNELREILPDLIAAARLVRRDVPGAQFVLARAPRLADDLLEPATRAASDADALPLAIVEGRADDVLAAVGRGLDRVGHRDRPDGAARAADGDRLPAVEADVCGGTAVREDRHVRHGQSRRGAEDRAGADSGRLHAANPRRARSSHC